MYGQAHAHAACLTFLIMRARDCIQLAALTPHVGNYACVDSESTTTKKQLKCFFYSGCLFVVRSARHDVRPENTSAAVGCGTKQEYKSRTRINVWRIKFYRRRSLARDVAFCAGWGQRARRSGGSSIFYDRCMRNFSLASRFHIIPFCVRPPAGRQTMRRMRARCLIFYMRGWLISSIQQRNWAIEREENVIWRLRTRCLPCWNLWFALGAAPVCAPKGPDLNFHTITFGPVKMCASRYNEILITRMRRIATKTPDGKWITAYSNSGNAARRLEIKETCFVRWTEIFWGFSSSIKFIITPDLCSFLIAFSCLFQVYLRPRLDRSELWHDVQALRPVALSERWNLPHHGEIQIRVRLPNRWVVFGSAFYCCPPRPASQIVYARIIIEHKKERHRFFLS